MTDEPVREESGHVVRATGYLHLTPRGWVRLDTQPFPDDRIETWHWQTEPLSGELKERVRLTRVSVSMTWTLHQARQLRDAFGEPVVPSAAP